MELSRKQKVGIVAIYTLSAVAVGRYGVPITKTSKVETSKTNTVAKDTSTHDTKAKKTKTTVTETTNKDGSKTKKTEVVVEDKTVADKDVAKSKTAVDTKKDTETQVAQVGHWHVSLLGGLNVLSPASSGFVYGAAASRDIIGPFNLGLFGLSTGVMGLSAGLNF